MATWQAFPLGAGGQVTNISIAADGTKACRTDAYGAYYFNPLAANPGNAGGTGAWQQIVTKQSIPDAISRISAGTWDSVLSGVYEIVVCPSNTQRFYMFALGHVMRSDDRGTTWTDTAFSPITATGNASGSKFFGPYIAVDPSNADKLIVGTPQDGAFYSLDAGASWTPITAVGAGIPSISSQLLGTSTTSHNVATATNVSFTTNTSFNLSVGQAVRAYQTSNPANQLVGVVGSSGNTGTTLFMTVTSVWGSGTAITDWSFYLPIQSNGSGTQSAGNIIAFDGSSTVYISTYGIGVFKSTTGPSGTFTLTTSTPTTHQHMIVDQSHNLWLIDDSSYLSGGLNKFNGSSWSAIAAASAGGGLATVLVDPSNALNVIVGNQGGSLNFSRDGGSTWTGLSSGNAETATDIPWLSKNEAFMTTGNQVFDPSTGTIWFGEGIGVWTTTPPGSGNTVNWTSVSAGIEELVSIDVIGPPGGAPIFGVLDRGAYRGVAPLYPSDYGPNYTRNLIDGWCVDYCSSLPSTVVALTYDGDGLGPGAGWQGGISTDGGSTWSVMAAQPGAGTGQNGGMIAASSPSNIMYCGANFGTPYYTTTGGTSWNKVTIGSIPDGEGYSSFASFLNRKTLAADRVDANTFYLYNSGTTAPGIYISTDSGATWTLKKSGLFHAGEVSANARLKSVPGNSGNLFYSPGAQVGGTHPDSTTALWKSTDHGLNWTAITNMTDVWDFGFGVAKPGGSGYPAIFAYGWLSNVLGVWQSDDGGSTWTSIGDGFPVGSFSQVRCVYGDGITYGKVYVGTGGQAFFTNVVSTTTTTTVGFSVIHGHARRHTKMIGY